jgi:hypothetical protein
MQEKLSSVNFLIGFVIFFVYLAAIFGFAAKFGKTPISKRKELRKQDIFFQFLVFSPVIAVFTYIIEANFAFLILLLVALFMLVFELFFQRPRLNRYLIESESLYKSLKLVNQEDKYCFEAENATILLN